MVTLPEDGMRCDHGNQTHCFLSDSVVLISSKSLLRARLNGVGIASTSQFWNLNHFKMVEAVGLKVNVKVSFSLITSNQDFI
jgi:hypothetical protein